MTTQVLTGYFAKSEDLNLYTNNTGQNVRVIFNYLSLEGTGTNEVRITTPQQTQQTPAFDDVGRAITKETVIPASYVQIPNLPDVDNDWIEGIVGNKLTSSSLNYDWYWRRWWGFNPLSTRGGDNPYGYMFLTSSQEVLGSKYKYFGFDSNWWRKYRRSMEIPFPIELYLKPNQSLVFVLRRKNALDERNRSSLPIAPQQITYNVLVMPEGGCG